MLRKSTSLFVWCLCLVIFLISSAVYGQSAKDKDDKLEQEIHLENGWIIRGKILEETNEKVRVETREGNVFVFTKDKITSISYKKRPKKSSEESGGYSPMHHLLTGGIMTGKNVSRTDRNVAFSFFSSSGLHLNANVQLGLGYGVDLYREVVIAPVAVDIRIDLLKKSVATPFIFGNLGYGLAISNRSDSFGNDPLQVWENKGGLRYNGGLGMKVRNGMGVNWVISVGYFYQKSMQEKQHWTGGKLEKTVQYRRLSINTGISF